MAVPSTSYPVLQMSAIARAENLRRHEISVINKALGDFADTHYVTNAYLTGRERICRLANQLESIKDLTQEVKAEINDIVKKLRNAFDLQHDMPYDTTYRVITKLIDELSQKYPVYDISKKLRTYNRFVGVNGVTAVKAETASMVTQLLIIGMNADGEGFRADLEKTLQETTEVMLSWM